MMGKYYLGLDIGTNSVGWAVTNSKYELCKFRRKDMWGIRLFEQANTAEERRMKRSVRRRLQRRNQRLRLLQELFAEEIAKIDDTFFIRLNESKLHIDDKSVREKHPLFTGTEYTDIDYYKEYPTMYHLRKALIEGDKQYDLRLIYLAIHHILKNRGHFLIDGDLSSAKSFENTYNQFFIAIQDELNLNIDIANPQKIENILRDKRMAKSEKAKKIEKEISVYEDGVDKEELKTIKSQIKHICAFMVGNKGDLNKLFVGRDIELEKGSFKFSDSAYEDEVRDLIEAQIPEYVHIVDSIKAIYDWSILVDILDGEDYLSFSKVGQYEEHKANLATLKKIIRKYCQTKVYNDFFSDPQVKISYSAYVGYLKKNGKEYAVESCNEEDFYKELKKILSQIKPETDDESVLAELILKAEMQNLLPLQRSKDNGVVPNQVHKVELEKIIENASKHYTFLSEQDSQGITTAEKIMSIFTFRIPYYVGPLSDRHKDTGANVWIARKLGQEDGKIYPWNFKDKVDLEKSNEAFIRRMTNKCTYICGEDVLPKNSLIYTRYMVLNELNNLKIRGKAISVELKQQIYHDLFERHTKVTGKRLLDYLKNHLDSELQKDDLSGFDQDFKASLSTYLDFEKQIFGDRMAEDKVKEIVENIVKWKTIYGDDKQMTKNVVQRNYPDELSDDQLSKMNKFRYSGWGNFSEKFLCEIEGADAETGEQFTILEALWKTNNNLMQLLSKNFTFKANIDKHNSDFMGEITDITYDALVKDLYTSPANKRAIWQSIQIAEEVREIMGCPPEKIFVEMARGGEKEKKRTDSRKKKLLDLYAGCKCDTRNWTEEIDARADRDFNAMKLYLYYTQMGKCMYTGEEIDIDELMTSNSKWDRDHIYPQSKIKDDSIDNLVLVNKAYNAKKSNEMLSNEIQKKQYGFWKELLEGGFISKKKYDRLTRRDEFSTDELAGFISRQLVETRQSSKAVAELLGRMYPEANIIYVKSALASQFRKNDLGMLKCRRINDYHHAHDAYLNIVVGDIYDAKFTSNPSRWIKENRDKQYSINKVFYKDIYRGSQLIWQGYVDKSERTGGTIETIREMVKRNTVLHTEYTYCQNGQLFNETISKKGTNTQIRLKKELETEKYGGYTSPNTSHFALVEFDGKKGVRAKQIVEVPIYIVLQAENNANAMIEYLENVKRLKNAKILRDKIKKNSLIVVDGFPMRIRGANEATLIFKGNTQLIVGVKRIEIIRKIEKYLEKDDYFDASEKFDGFTSDDLDEIYDVLLDKFKNSIYKKRPANQGANLEAYRTNFINLESLGEKAKIINQIINMCRCDNNTTANLKSIGGTENAGSMKISKNTVVKNKIVLVNQSVTGLFENRIEL